MYSDAHDLGMRDPLLSHTVLGAIAIATVMASLPLGPVAAQYDPYQPPAPPAPTSEEVCGPNEGQSSCYYVYLANFSTGRAEFFLAPSRIWFVWQIGKDVQKVCDLSSQSFFAPTTLFPQNACRIKVDVTHEYWLSAKVWYVRTTESGANYPIAYFTPGPHLPPAGVRPGAVFEFDACGERGAATANCGWREIIQEDRKY